MEADRIARCLSSLDFCDDIVVVDSGSTDGTTEIARQHGASITLEDANPAQATPGLRVSLRFNTEPAR